MPVHHLSPTCHHPLPTTAHALPPHPSRFAPGAASTGKLKQKGRRPFVTPVAPGSAGRKFKAPGKTAGTPGSACGPSRLAASKPAVQLHNLEGSLLRQLLASTGPAAHAAAAGEPAAVPDAGRADASKGAAAAGPPAPQPPAPASPLPLDSTVCAEWRVPDLPPPPGSASPAEAAAATAAGEVSADGSAAAATAAGELGAGVSTAAAAAAVEAAAAAEMSAAAAPAAGGDALATGQPLPASVGWQELRQRLLDAGANPSYATADWARNHYRWVVWKLARLCLSLCGGGGGGSGGASPAVPHLLTAAVVLDELKIRCAGLSM